MVAASSDKHMIDWDWALKVQLDIVAVVVVVAAKPVAAVAVRSPAVDYIAQLCMLE
jgi:hypothetical protein